MNPNRIKKKKNYITDITVKLKTSIQKLKRSEKQPKTDRLPSMKQQIENDFSKQGETRLERKQSNIFRVLTENNY